MVHRRLGAAFAAAVLLLGLVAVITGPPAAAAGAFEPVAAPTSGLNPPAGADPQAAIGGEGSIHPVSCGAVGSCVAVGGYLDDAGHHQALIETLTSGTWTPMTAPLTGLSPTPGTDPQAFLGAVSCATASSCVAMGGYGDSGGGRQVLIETFSGGTWTSSTLSTAGLSPTPDFIFPSFLQCTSAGSCVAGGNYSASSVSYAWAASSTGGVWTAQTAPSSGLSPALGSTTGYFVTGGSCSAADSCVLVGSYFDASTTSHPLIERLAGGTWTSSTGPVPSGGTSGSLSTASCPSATSCVVTGSFTDAAGHSQLLLETLSGTTWTASTISTSGLSPAPGADPQAGLNPITCVAVGDCVSFGSYTDANGGFQGLIATLRDGTWSLAAVPTGGLSPAPKADPQTFLGSVACTSSGTCTAVGGYAATGGNEGLIGTSTGGVWTFSAAPTSGLNPPIAASAGVLSYLTGLSCPAAGNCVASGLYTDSSNHREGLFEVQSTPITPPARSTTGYWMVGTDGGLFAFGSAAFAGSTGDRVLNKPIVGMAPTPAGDGYWLVASDGGVFAFGAAGFFGSTGAIHLNSPIVAIMATPSGQGYWLVAADGGVFAFGDAVFFGSTGGIRLNLPVVGAAATPSGNGYWLVARDGGIFAFGDAAFFGSTGGIVLNRPVVGIAVTPGGGGYWLVATDGGVFAFGDAGFLGSTGGIVLNKPVVAIIASLDGQGYWLIASDGGVFSFGKAPFFGSTGNLSLNSPIVGGSGAPG